MEIIALNVKLWARFKTNRLDKLWSNNRMLYRDLPGP